MRHLHAFGKGIHAPKITAARGIRFNGKRAADLGKLRDQLLRHLHIRHLSELRLAQTDLPAADARRQQQGTGELRTLLQTHRARRGARAGPVDGGGQLVVRRVHRIPQRAQRLKQFALRPFVHAMDAMQFHWAVPETNQRR